jgi:hypothetical protein
MMRGGGTNGVRTLKEYANQRRVVSPVVLRVCVQSERTLFREREREREKTIGRTFWLVKFPFTARKTNAFSVS